MFCADFDGVRDGRVGGVGVGFSLPVFAQY